MDDDYQEGNDEEQESQLESLEVGGRVVELTLDSILRLFYFEERCDLELIGVEIFGHQILDRFLDIVLVLEQVLDEINVVDVFLQ